MFLFLSPGIAPFRGIWQKRAELSSHSHKTTHLFFGCRDETENLFAFERNGSEAVRRRVAYSRQKGHPKQYVQDLMMEEKQLICDVLIEQGGVLLVWPYIQLTE